MKAPRRFLEVDKEVETLDKKKCEAPGCTRDFRLNRDGYGLCNMHYQRMRSYGSFENPPRKKPPHRTCTVDGCEKLSRTVGGKYCEMHYGRMYRNGHLGGPTIGRKFVSSHGYVISYSPEHALAGKTGVLYEHRRVLYDSIGYGEHSCHWCLKLVEWKGKGKDGLVVDHLDNNKENNSLSNLVASCHACNSTRGLFMSWVHKHKDDPFLLRLFNIANDNTSKQAVAA